MDAQTRITAVQGDLTVQKVDAVVNAANSSLMGGGGVDGAIHRAGGPEILAECKTIVARAGRLLPGKAVSTTAGRMPAKRVIHTVGPIWRGGGEGEPETLASAYAESLAAAAREGLKTIAFPSISTGAYGYPVKDAASVAVGAVAYFLSEHPGIFEEIRFVLFSENDLKIYENAISDIV